MKWPPNYVNVYAFRQRQLTKMRADKKLIAGAKAYYAGGKYSEFISHWCDTYDPRNAGTSTLARMPFVLFPRQQQLIEFFYAHLCAEENGLVEKCRDMGATWCAVGFSVCLWLFLPGASVGWGSRKEQLVDRIGDMDSIFEKIRFMIDGLPRELLPFGFDSNVHATYMRLVNPENGAAITGESGDNIGRGGRKLIYFKDESAHYEHAEKIEAALTDNTRCQIDMSSVNGLGNVFHKRREAGVEWEPGKPAIRGKTGVFVMDWRDHPGKTQEWYDERKSKASAEGLLHLFAQEVDRNYSASITGTIIKLEWVKSAVDAHVKLGLDDSGLWTAALDVADEGGDTNAFSIRKGVVLKKVSEWGEGDTGFSARQSINMCRGLGPIELNYDCVGVGAGVKTEANRLIQDGLMPDGVRLVPWSGGAEVKDKDDRLIPGDEQSPKNGDFFGNFKAQAWWNIARKLETTWRAINEPGFTWHPDQIVSFSSDISPLIMRKIEKELCQVTKSLNTRMKLIINKAPANNKSPNIADSIVMVYFPVPFDEIPMPVFSSYG